MHRREIYVEYVRSKLIRYSEIVEVVTQLENVRVARYNNVTGVTSASSATFLYPRDTDACIKCLESLLMRYYDRQKSWLKRVEPYVSWTAFGSNHTYCLEFSTMEMCDEWMRDAQSEGLYLEGTGSLISFRLPLLTVVNNDLRDYLRKEWSRL